MTPIVEAFDRSIWRIVGDPLTPSIGSGPLLGESVAVKDLYAVAGHQVGAGNPTWLATSPVEHSHAWAVRTLIGAGAQLRGIARTDEFAYSLAGTNVHYGTPPNPAAPGRISGGSSSGSAAAVALGHATIGLGTDTGGSIRIPSAYQGLFGIRTTHDAVPRHGLMALAPSFDTVGWMTRDAGLLREVGAALLPERAPDPAREFVTVRELSALARPDVATAIEEFTRTLGDVAVESWTDAGSTDWRDVFTVRQAAEAWEQHGWWLRSRLDSLGADVRGRFERARDLDDAERADSHGAALAAGERIRELLGGRILVLPSAPTPAPAAGEDSGRDATLRLTCLAGLGGLPAVNVPLRTAEGLPCGVCLVAAPGRDLDLLDLLVENGYS